MEINGKNVSDLVSGLSVTELAQVAAEISSIKKEKVTAEKAIIKEMKETKFKNAKETIELFKEDKDLKIKVSCVYSGSSIPEYLINDGKINGIVTRVDKTFSMKVLGENDEPAVVDGKELTIPRNYSTVESVIVME